MRAIIADTVKFNVAVISICIFVPLLGSEFIKTTFDVFFLQMEKLSEFAPRLTR